MVRFKPLYFTLLLAGFMSLTLGQSRPEAADLEASFRGLVPNGWELVELLVEVQENYGTEVEPDIRTRFQAAVMLQHDTFEPAGELMGANLLRPVLVAGEQRKFYGVAQSARRLGEWETTFTLENNPTVGTGFVLDSFAGRRLVLGSVEAAEYRAELEAEAEATTASEVARLTREERIREQERVSEQAELAHANSLRETEAQAVREAEVARIAQEQILAAAIREQEAAERATREAELELLQEQLVERLAAELRVRLAVHWEIEDVEGIGMTRSGSYDEPVFTLSFIARLQLQEGTFTTREVEGGGQILDPLQTRGTSQTLEGTTNASWVAGNWELNIQFNNLDGFSVGLPKAYYPPTAVLAGGSEEAAYWRTVEQAAQEELDRELAAIARQQQLDDAKHEAARTAAAQAAQLEAIGLAARAAEFASLEASLLESGDLNSQLAAFEHALTSGDDSLYWLAIEAALRSDQGLLIGRAIPIALTSGNTRVIDLALARTLLDGGGINFSRTNPNVNLILSDLTRHEDGAVSASLTGRDTTHNTNMGGAADELECGIMNGSLQNGHLALNNEICDLLVVPSGADALNAQVLSRRNFSYSLTSAYPGYRAAQ